MFISALLKFDILPRLKAVGFLGNFLVKNKVGAFASAFIYFLTALIWLFNFFFVSLHYMVKWYGYMHKILTENDKIKFLTQQLILANNKKYKLFHFYSEKEWYAFLKKKKLFQEYVNRINEICTYPSIGFSSSYFGLKNTDAIKKTCKRIDEFISGNGAYRWWQNLYDEFMFEKNKASINHIMSARLYMTDKKEKRHSTYIGSSNLKKSIYDTLIDGLFKLFTK